MSDIDAFAEPDEPPSPKTPTPSTEPSPVQDEKAAAIQAALALLREEQAEKNRQFNAELELLCAKYGLQMMQPQFVQFIPKQ